MHNLTPGHTEIKLLAAHLADDDEFDGQPVHADRVDGASVVLG